jgi:hypothetical protein
MIGGNATSLLAVDLLGVPIADESTPIQARRLAQDDRPAWRTVGRPVVTACGVPETR